MWTLRARKGKNKLNFTTDNFKGILQLQRKLLLDYWEIEIYQEYETKEERK